MSRYTCSSTSCLFSCFLSSFQFCIVGVSVSVNFFIAIEGELDVGDER